MIEVRNKQVWAALPCGAVSSAPAPHDAPEGQFEPLAFASGQYLPAPAGTASIIPPQGEKLLHSGTIDARLMLWVLHDAAPADEPGWIHGGYVCSSHNRHRMRALRITGGPGASDISVSLPAAVWKYFLTAAGDLWLCGYGSGWTALVDANTARALWLPPGPPHPYAEKAHQLLTAEYDREEAWSSGCEKLTGRHMYFDKALTRGVPAGRVVYNMARDSRHVIVWHNKPRMYCTAVADYKEVANHADE